MRMREYVPTYLHSIFSENITFMTMQSTHGAAPITNQVHSGGTCDKCDGQHPSEQCPHFPQDSSSHLTRILVSVLRLDVGLMMQHQDELWMQRSSSDRRKWR